MPETIKNGTEWVSKKMMVYGFVFLILAIAGWAITSLAQLESKHDKDVVVLEEEHKKDVVVLHGRINEKCSKTMVAKIQKDTKEDIGKIEGNVEKIKEDVNSINVSIGKIEQMMKGRQ